LIPESQLEYALLQDIIGEYLPDLFLKIVGKADNLGEFHHDLWQLPFYQKLVEKSKNMNTTTYLYLSDKNVSSSNLFFIYEITVSKFSLKGTHSIEKRILNIKENLEEYRTSLKYIIIDNQAKNVSTELWNYTVSL